jgi:MoaA/NifB/PqqE/SkfB family radical SAM enzyme
MHDNESLQAQEIAQRKTILDSRPSVYNIELTGRCNCNPPCVFCVCKNLPDYVAPGNLDFSIIEKSSASLGRAERINDCSYGEPLLYPQFESLVDKLSAAGIRFGFSTNGLLLNERRVSFLVRHAKNLEFVVSLNAVTPETYYKLVGQDFDAVIEKIRRSPLRTPA